MAERDPALHILQHALGLDDHGLGRDGRSPFNTYRNHYVDGGVRASDVLFPEVSRG